MRQQGNITIAVWQDNKPVSLLATNVDPTKTASVNRKNKDGSSRTIPCPETPLLYNKYMGGVDLNDQLRGYYQLRMKGRKYYKYIFWFLVDLAITRDEGSQSGTVSSICVTPVEMATASSNTTNCISQGTNSNLHYYQTIYLYYNIAVYALISLSIKHMHMHTHTHTRTHTRTRTSYISELCHHISNQYSELTLELELLSSSLLLTVGFKWSVKSSVSEDTKFNCDPKKIFLISFRNSLGML